MIKCRPMFALSVALTSAGCMTEKMVTDSYQQPVVQPMAKVITSLIGQPSSVAFRRLDPPNMQKIQGTRKSYIWTTPSGDCVIRLFVDGSEVVTNGDWTGSVAGCSAYIQRFNSSMV